MTAPFISNERQAYEVAANIEQLDLALSSDRLFKSIVAGLPHQIAEDVRSSLAIEKRELTENLSAFQKAKSGDFGSLKLRAGNDPGALLIVARLSNGWSQKELARKLGLREQAIQRYEAERYRSISLAGFLRVARTLRTQVVVDILTSRNSDAWLPSYEMPANEAHKILKHARAQGWLKDDKQTDEDAISQIKRYVAEHIDEHGTPSLLRTGLNVKDHSGDWALLAWKAQVTRRAKEIIRQDRIKFKLGDYSWLVDLVHLSAQSDGPMLTQDILKKNGIILIIETQISGMKVDGAAFLIDGVPIIGLTLIRDSLDSFWFTLLHEVAHVVLHYRTGLSSGFYDDIDTPLIDELERAANRFASNMLIPEEVWTRSPARIAKAAAPVESLAANLGISPAILFGRLRMERKNYTIFSDRIGQGKVRKQFFR